MNINVKGMLGGAARVAAGAALLVAAGSSIAPAHAAKKAVSLISASSGGSGDGPLLADYFDLDSVTGDGDTIIRLANISGSPECALIYVFDTNQQLQEACSVGLSPNKELALSTEYELVSNPAFSSAFEYGYAGLIEVVSAEPVTSVSSSPFASDYEGIACDPSQTVVPITAIEAWSESVVSIFEYDSDYYATSAAVTPFTNGGDPDAANLTALQGAITFLGSELGSSGDGICSTYALY